MVTISGNVVTINGKRFRLDIEYSFSGNAIIWTAKANILDEFSKAHDLTLSWVDNGITETATASGKTKTYTFKERTLNGRTIQAKLKVSGSATTSDINYTVGPSQPNHIEAVKLNDNAFNVIVSGVSETGNKKTQSITIERSSTSLYTGYSAITDDPISVSPDANGNYSLTYTDEGTEAGNRYWWRAKATNAISGDSGYEYCGPYFTSADASAITNVATSKSGNSVTITWNCSNSAIQNGTITTFYVQRSSNGGTYTTVGTVKAVAGTTSYSYTDTVDEGGSYQYQVSASNESGGTSSGGTGGGGEIETAPNKPSNIAVYRNSSDNVVITVTGESSNADSVVIDRCIDGGSWSEGIATINYASTVTYTDTEATASDNIVYRAKYTNSTGSSGYVISAAVQIKQKPNAPILKTPVSGSPIDMAAGTVRLVWQHRPLDGSPQTAATLQYSLDSGTTWTTVSSITTATYYDLSLTGMSANAVITWQVKTKGSHADYSDFSSQSTFKLLTKPTLAFTEPDNADVIDELPVVMEFSYNDACGTLEELRVDIIKKNEVVKTVNVDVGAGTSGTYTHNLKGFLFDNNTVYGLKAYALSSSGLSDETSISITIQYAEVSIAGALIPSVTCDSDTGYARISCSRDVTPGQGGVVPSPVTISEAYLYRVHDGETTLISAVSEGMQMLDKYAPINVDFEYKLLMLTSTGAVSIVSVTVKNRSPYWFCYFGDEIAKAKWNPEGSVKLSRPQRTEVRYSGRRYPVSYDQDAIEETFDFTTVFTEREELNAFRKMIRKGGTGIWKSGDGDVYDANFEFSYSSDYRLTTQIWNASLSVTRIDGEGGR